ncbi:uncharacterized protein TNCV_4982321, partial [Trichonephila clavipes]
LNRGKATVESINYRHTILEPHRLPGCFRPGCLLVGTISCPLLPTCFDGTLRAIDLTSNTVHRRVGDFHADDDTPLKLA